ncbi:MAG: hypothetical protein GTN99_10500, partial [Candidatus Dadabacteria bacterium]|nr:hypothetical protein [Candidatus Dadabacteria bacterium]NIT14644.1 hypothetical protein [Candidatus Dadabacteria bacterium]
IEVNAEIEKRRAERQKAQEERIKAQREAAGADVSAGADTGISDLNVTGPSSLYQWRDKDGILHVTDDLGSVPPEYRDQAYKNSQ